MSDVGEHDSDSDTEINRIKEKPQSNVTAKPEAIVGDVRKDQQQNGGVAMVKISAAASKQEYEGPSSSSTIAQTADVLDELKQQAANVAAADQKPEWQKYLEQNQQTGAYTYTDPNDGTVYEWDEQKRGWIPKIDEDFIAMYQANYGFTATGEHDPNVNVQPEEVPETTTKSTDNSKDKIDPTGKKRKTEEKAEWFDIDPKKNNNVYISGLPDTATEEEFEAFMSKCGIIMADDRGQLKLKLYKTPDGKVKGDGRCCYLKYESVVLACDILDESDFNGSKVHVEKAVFELKGEYDPSKKPKKKKNKKKKPGKAQEKLLDWVDRPKKRSKFDRIVILKNMFNHKEFEKDPSMINDLKKDLRSECERFGEVKKVLVFDRNPEGVASVLFQEPEFADECIAALNGRYYAKRTINAETYDGVTNYEVQETEEELQKRLEDWERFISGEDDGE